MAYIRCASGGGGAVEVITGTMTGASGATEAGRVTVTSQQGKTPKRAMFWRTDKATGAGTGGTFWWANTDNIQYNYVYTASLVISSRAVPTATAQANYSIIYGLTSDSITFACPTNATYYGTNVTWAYSVEFE